MKANEIKQTEPLKLCGGMQGFKLGGKRKEEPIGRKTQN